MISGTRFHDWAEWFFDHYKDVENWEGLIPDEFTDNEKEMCRTFLKDERARLEGLKSLGREDEFVPAFKESHFVYEGENLHGYIDRVDTFDKAKKEYVIVEYKTGWGFNLAKLKQELSFYKLIFDKAGVGTAVKFLIINPKRRIREYVNASPRGVTAVKKRINKLRMAIDNNDFPQCCAEEKRKWCRHCESEDSDCYEHQI